MSKLRAWLGAMVARYNEGKLGDKLGRELVRCAGKGAVRELVWGLGSGELGFHVQHDLAKHVYVAAAQGTPGHCPYAARLTYPPLSRTWPLAVMFHCITLSAYMTW